MRSTANSHIKMAKVSCRVPDTSVRGSRDHAESPNQQTWRKREVRYFEHKHPDFFKSSTRKGLTEQTYGEKRWGHRPFWDLKKKRLSPIAIHTKTGMLFGQHVDGELVPLAQEKTWWRQRSLNETTTETSIWLSDWRWDLQTSDGNVLFR